MDLSTDIDYTVEMSPVGSDDDSLPACYRIVIGIRESIVYHDMLPIWLSGHWNTTWSKLTEDGIVFLSRKCFVGVFNVNI